MLNTNTEEIVDWLDVNDISIFGPEFRNAVEIITDLRFHCGEKRQKCIPQKKPIVQRLSQNSVGCGKV